jgi:deoxyadenosine/deoxycytidine kinase
MADELLFLCGDSILYGKYYQDEKIRFLVKRVSIMANTKYVKQLIVEGNIGAGKSTFLKMAQEHLCVDAVQEPCNKWQAVGDEGNLLELFYKDTPRWAYTFQTNAFITRIMEQEARIKISPYAFQMLERSVFCDRFCFAKNCYEQGLMKKIEWKLYCEWFEWLVGECATHPSGFIYLKTDPKICFSRLSKRNRSEEIGVGLSYLEQLHEKHELWLIGKSDLPDYLKNVPVLVLSCDKDFEYNDLEQMAHVQKIADFFDVPYKEESRFYPYKKEKTVTYPL